MTAIGQLGAVEARRMLRHPAYFIGLLLPASFAIAAIVNDETGPPWNFAFVLLFLMVTLVYAPVTVVAANRVAGATYRRRVRDPFDCTPLGDRQRTAAAVVGLLRGPVAVGLAGALALLAIGRFTAATNVREGDGVYQRTVLEYLQLPALVLGAGLLGIAVARWLLRPGALPLVAAVLWAGTIGLYAYSESAVVPARTWFAPWPVWLAGENGMLPRQPLGQEMWHLAYLLGLGVLAGLAALLRGAGPRRRLVLAAAIVAVATGAAALLQLG
ncbi:hypothetical protein [Actinoplanes sp. RD1]|uniref:hypothetical protein n=1 Tax=Actinoplanes sp. RD1 TaxID=3064538 RepID=UPI00274071FD|nr:hypothetical protein [Actinoplanes sp. RD1]